MTEGIQGSDKVMADATMPARRRFRSGLTRLPWRRVIQGVLLLCALPFVLTLVYAVVPPVSVPMIERYATGQPVDRRWTALKDIAPVARFSVMASEDGRFCRHWGVDVDAISLVLEQGGDEGPSRGASTIAMQTAKNLYLWPLPTLLRKPLEIPLALWINLVWQKRRTLEVYLNIAEWGDGLYGIEAASEHYFRKPASRLTPHEAALLAVALPNPIRRDAAAPSRRLRNLAGLIAKRARNSAGYFDCVK